MTIQPRLPNRADYVEFANAHGMGIEVIELSDPSLDELASQALVVEYQRLLAGFDGPRVLHGPYIDLYVNSPDAGIRRVSERRIIASLQHAELLGIERVVFHTNHLPCTTKAEYTVAWRAANIAFWSRIVDSWPGTVLLENMWDDGPELLRSVIDGVGSSRLRACLDLGHAHIFSGRQLAEWIEVLGAELDYIHLSDNGGRADDALPPGQGSIDWAAVSAALETAPGRPAVMLGIGLGGLPAIAETMRYLRSEHLYPAS